MLCQPISCYVGVFARIARTVNSKNRYHCSKIDEIPQDEKEKHLSYAGKLLPIVVSTEGRERAGITSVVVTAPDLCVLTYPKHLLPAIASVGVQGVVFPHFAIVHDGGSSVLLISFYFKSFYASDASNCINYGEESSV